MLCQDWAPSKQTIHGGISNQTSWSAWGTAWLTDGFVILCRVRTTSGQDPSPQDCVTCKMFLRGSLVSLPGVHPQPPPVPWAGHHRISQWETPQRLASGTSTSWLLGRFWAANAARRGNEGWGARIWPCASASFSRLSYFLMRHTPCSPNISRVSISGSAIISQLNPSMRLYPLYFMTF